MKATLLLVLLCFATCCFGQKKQRLVAEVLYGPDSNGILTAQDSAHFTYSGQRHSEFDYNRLDYTRYLPSDMTGSFFELAPVMNNIDSIHNYRRIAFDSLIAYNYRYSLDQSYKVDHREVCTYNGDGTPGILRRWIYLRDTVPFYSFRETIAYTNGSVSKMYLIDVDSTNTAIDTLLARFFIRDADGKVIIDSIAARLSGKMMPYEQTYYSYDASGRYTVRDINSYDGTEEKHTFTYYPNGQVRTFLKELRPNFSPMTPLYLDSFGYVPGVAGYTSLTHITFDTLGMRVPDFGSIYTAHIDALNRKDYATSYVNSNGVIAVYSEVVFYNGDGNPDTKILYDITSGFGLPIEQHKYYYEYYDAATQIASSVAARPSPISLSPNPATSTLTLHYSQPLSNTPITISISNTVGRVLQRTTLIPQGLKTDIPLSEGIPPGMYSVSVQSKGNPPIFRGNFLKL